MRKEKRTLRWIACWLIAALFASLTVVIPAAKPVCAADISIKGNYNFAYYQKNKSMNTYEIEVSNSEEDEIEGVRLIGNTDSSVASFTYDEWTHIIYVKLRKPGMTTMTVEIATSEFDNEGVRVDIKEKRSFTVNSIEYRCPVKKLKIGKKSYKSKFKSSNTYKAKKHRKIKKQKLSIKPIKGWEVKSILLEYGAGWGVNEKYLKNNKRFSSPKDGEITIEMYNAELGLTEYLYLR